jgi:hypothetical protein
VHPVGTTSNVMSQNGVIVVPGLSTNQPLRGYGKEPRLKQAGWAKRGKYLASLCSSSPHASGIRREYDNHFIHHIDR